MQSKLLRVIERGKIFPLGSNEEVAVAARFVFSADGAIEEKVRRTANSVPTSTSASPPISIFLPPLRERKNDIDAAGWAISAQRSLNRDEDRQPGQKDAAALPLARQHPRTGKLRRRPGRVAAAAWTDNDVGRSIRPAAAHPGPHPVRRTHAGRGRKAEYTAYLLRKYGTRAGWRAS